MRLSKYFLCLSFITIIGLVYSHQHFLITKANYAIIKYEDRLLQLLDRNKKLMYNVTTLESPAHLEAKLSLAGVKFDAPKRWANVKIVESASMLKIARVAKRRNVVVDRIVNFIIE